MIKGRVFSILAAFLSLALFAASASAMESVRGKSLQQGTVLVYDLGPLKLHAYQTADAMADACFALETEKNLVAIESPPFDANITEWKSYLETVSKPLTDILISYHPGGGQWYGSATSHATAGARQAMTAGATMALTESLGKAFGPGFNTQVPGIDSLLNAGPNTVGGIALEIIEAGDGYDIAIPSAKIIYTHMLGADSHSILAGQGHIDAVLASLESMKAEGYRLILSSHHTPESPADVDTKIAYVKRVRELAAQSSGKDDFVARVKKEYPAYTGENYLDMTAGYLFEK